MAEQAAATTIKAAAKVQYTRDFKALRRAVPLLAAAALYALCWMGPKPSATNGTATSAMAAKSKKP